MLTCREKNKEKMISSTNRFFSCRAERDSWNVSERIHWMKKWGSCRENLQLWPPFLTPVPFSLDDQSLCCATLSLTVWFPQVSRKCHFLSQNSPTLYLLLSSHVSFPWTDDQSYLLQPWAKLETLIFFLADWCPFTFTSFAQSSHFWFDLNWLADGVYARLRHH